MHVDLYRTKAAAAGYVHSLSAEEVAPAGLYAVTETIARYPGSPVPAVAACLNGKSEKRGGSHKSSGGKKSGSFTF